MRIKLFANMLIGRLLLLMAVIICISFKSHSGKLRAKRTAKVLVFSKTSGYRHGSIPAGIAAIKKLGEENNFEVDATEDSAYFTDANLKQYKAIVFLSTTGNILGPQEEQAFQNYINNGGGFVGIHAATDCEYGWPWYVKMVGANFQSHPRPQTAKLVVTDKKHLSTKHLPEVWERKDEWYNFKNINPDIKVVLRLDETSYTGGRNGENHPMAWYHNYEGGRIFYTGIGHTDESFSEPLLVQHLLGGIKYALGRK